MKTQLLLTHRELVVLDAGIIAVIIGAVLGHLEAELVLLLLFARFQPVLGPQLLDEGRRRWIGICNVVFAHSVPIPVTL